MNDEPIHQSVTPLRGSSIEDLLCQAVAKGSAPMINNIAVMMRAGLGWRGMTAALHFALPHDPAAGVGITITIEPLDLRGAVGGTCL